MKQPPTKPIRQQFRQGQTRWMPVVYWPDAFLDNPDSYVLQVEPCFITKVRGVTVYYDIPSGPYKAHRNFMHEKSCTSKNAAFRKGLAVLNTYLGIDGLALVPPGTQPAWA